MWTWTQTPSKSLLPLLRISQLSDGLHEIRAIWPLVPTPWNFLKGFKPKYCLVYNRSLGLLTSPQSSSDADQDNLWWRMRWYESQFRLSELASLSPYEKLLWPVNEIPSRGWTKSSRIWCWRLPISISKKQGKECKAPRVMIQLSWPREHLAIPFVQPP